MSDESYRVISRTAMAVAAIEALLTLLWIGGFASGGSGSSDSFRWYVELPLVFLVVPILVMAGSRFHLATATSDWGCLTWLLLGINIAVFATYAMMAGGGV